MQNPFTILPHNMPADARRHRAVALIAAAVLLVLFGFVAVRPFTEPAKDTPNELSRR